MEVVASRKMIDHGLIRCIVILIVARASVLAFDCSEVHECFCHPDIGDSYRISCRLQNNSAFGVQIYPGRSVRVECTNSPKWSDFHVNMASLERTQVETMWFHTCDLPPNTTSLGDITHMLGVIDVNKLVFRSFKNLSSELTKHHLDGFNNLKQLVLSNNMISDLDRELLIDLPNLIALNLMENDINLPCGFFNYTPNLERLELSSNNLQSIELGIFDNLRKLRLLNLWKNNLTDFPSGIFDQLVALQSLDINTNNIVTLPEDIFAKLENLEVINLSRNYFEKLPKDLLRNNTKLDNVTLNNNRVDMPTLPREFFSNLTELKVLRLNWNGFVTLPEDLFLGSFSLTNISLTRNRLKTLPQSIFRDAKLLLSLELDMNELEGLPDNIFVNTNQLVKLDLSKNLLTSISKNMFSGLHKLRELNMENNHLTTIEHRSLNPMSSLRIARFSNNRLTLRSPLSNYSDIYALYSPFQNCLQLEELHVANNSISMIFNDWIFVMMKLRILDLKYNNISILSNNDLQFLSRKLKVDLTYNKIERIFINENEVMSIASSQTWPRDVIISVQNNPVICDCLMYSFLRYNEGRMHPYVQNYFHIFPGDLSCRSPKWVENMKVMDLRSKTLQCIINDANHFNISCPEECICILRPEDKALRIDCSSKNLTDVPSDVKDPGDKYKLGLDFSGNMIKKMPNLAELNLQSARLLDLSHNNISEIFRDGLPNVVQVLELHNNNISRISRDVLDFLRNSTNLTRLTLHGNPWECDCEATDFLDFVQTEYVKILNLPGVICRGKNYSISRMTMNDLCPSETELFIGISVVIAFIGILVGVFGFYYRYQRNIKVWLFARQWCLWFVTEEELDKEKLYDAFISYSHKDHQFVEEELVTKLESGPKPFKLCLHYRDWLAGEWIPAQIAKSVEDSRRTIVVLSPNFLESVWGRMEFRAAHSQALSEGRARVILILYGDIGPTDDMDPELKAYISMNTYVKWGDPWFWDKLRYALPHPSKSMSAAGRKIFENHQLCIQVVGDKKELIYPVGPLANTTPPADTLKTFICDERELPSTDLGYPLESPKANGDIAVIFEPKRLLTRELKIAALDNPQCTTVC
ncbi:PREDICTED: protein toll [Dinoponera quadriceps]|uniref:Protein toll n=1 Tax=Dinoponera quadriceps TaxID=609295 RepID=A0A6P3X379_DINQU|nr:PREDICTED: protein toll [Dinoponera quadriceps]XP_014472683.1 PREDICTED: protein toll [Dinoponera quadriceps]